MASLFLPVGRVGLARIVHELDKRDRTGPGDVPLHLGADTLVIIGIVFDRVRMKSPSSTF